MFAIDARVCIDEMLSREPWLYFGCASFEPRWDAFGRLAAARGVRPVGASALYPVDTESKWERECSKRQAANWATSVVSTTWSANRANCELPGGRPWDTACVSLGALAERYPGCPLVIDITTMPRTCFFPVVREALGNSTFPTVVAVYSEPRRYHSGSLATEPTRPTLLPGFTHLPHTGDRRLAVGWIPIVGFAPSFLDVVHGSFVDTYDVGSRVFPMVGFPAYDPTFFERALLEGGRAVLDAFAKNAGLREHFIYAAASDPFDTALALERLIRADPQLCWIGTPSGPKPMALGMLLASLRLKITIVVAPARSYHPDYSDGWRTTHAYVIKKGGLRGFEWVSE